MQKDLLNAIVYNTQNDLLDGIAEITVKDLLRILPVEKFNELKETMGYRFDLDGDTKEIDMFVDEEKVIDPSSLFSKEELKKIARGVYRKSCSAS